MKIELKKKAAETMTRPLRTLTQPPNTPPTRPLLNTPTLSIFQKVFLTEICSPKIILN